MPGDRQVVMSWDALPHDGVKVFEPTGVELCRSDTETGCTGRSAVWYSFGTATILQSTVTNLTNDTTYRFRMRPVNGRVAGAASDVVSVTPAAAKEPPSAVTALTATPGAAKVDLSWAAPGGTPEATGYEVCQGTTAGGCRMSADWTATGSTATSKEVTGLTNGTRYYFRVRALNGTSLGPVSQQASASPGMSVSARQPAQPTGLSAVPGDARVALSWTAPATASNPAATGYEVCASATASTGCTASSTNWAVATTGAAGTAATVTALSDNTKLTNGTQYYFKVRAVNGATKGAVSDEMSATPKARPGTPTGVTATPSSGQVALSWTAPANTTPTGYEYRVGTLYLGSETDWNDVASGTTATVSSLDNGVRHTFEVRSYVTSGTTKLYSLPAAVVQAPNVAVTGLMATAGNAKVDLSWTAPASGTQFLTGYEYCHGAAAGDCAGAGATWRPTGSRTATTHAANWLPNGSALYFQVRARYGPLPGLSSSEQSATPTVGAVTALRATNGNGFVELSWTGPPGPIGRYEVCKVTTSGGCASATTGTALGPPWATTSARIDSDNDETVYLAVRAVNAGETGAWSSEVSARPASFISKPDVVPGLVAAAGNASVTLTWKPSANPPAPTDYQYCLSVTAGACSPWLTVSSVEKTITVDGLANGTTYYFKVRGVNISTLQGVRRVATGPVSEEVSATPTASAPGKPAKFTVTPTAGRGLLLDWDAPASGAAPTGYEYRMSSRAIRKDVGAPESVLAHLPDDGVRSGWLPAGSIDSATSMTLADPSSSSDKFRSLKYFFQVRAKSASGSGALSEAVGATRGPRPSSGEEYLTATPGNAQVVLAWDDLPSDGVNAVAPTGYQWCRGATAAACAAAGARWTEVGADASTATVTGLTNNTEHHFALRALNGVVAAPVTNDSKASATPLEAAAPPGRVTGLTATPGALKVDLSWTAPEGTPAATGYQVCRATTAGGCTSSSASWNATSSTSTTTEVGGLTNGTRYWFRVRAVNDNSTGPPSQQASAAPAASARQPAAPTSLSARAGDARVALSWTAPAGTPAATGYEVCHATSAGGCTATAGTWTDSATGDSGTAHTVTGLTNGNTYYFKVRAVNGETAGVVSGEVSRAAEARPAIPTGVRATAGDAQVTLSWSAPADAAPDGYEYRVGIHDTGSEKGWTNVASGTSVMVGSLHNGVRYVFEVRAYAGTGSTRPGETVYSLPAAVVAVPNTAPTGFSVTAGDAEASLSWTAPATGLQTLTGYAYCSSTTADGCAGADATWASTANVYTPTHVVGGLTNDTLYHFAVRALYGTFAGTPTGGASATPMSVSAPGAPSELEKVLGNARVNLAWTAPSSGAVAHYEVCRSTTSGGCSASETRTTTAEPWLSVGGLTNSTTYYFAVRAVNSAGASAWTSEVSAAPDAAQTGPPAAPTGLAAAAGNASVTLTWSAPSAAPAPSGYEYCVSAAEGGCAASGAKWVKAPLALNSTVEGLGNGVTYYFQVRAVNGGSSGSASAEVPADTTGSAPAAPTNLTASVNAARRPVLAWTPPVAPTGTMITGYEYRLSAAPIKKDTARMEHVQVMPYLPDDGLYGAWRPAGSGPGHTVVDFLPPSSGENLKFFFQVRATSSEGPGAPSAPASATLWAVPSQEKYLTAVAGDSRVTLTWDPLPHDGVKLFQPTDFEYCHTTDSASISSDCSASAPAWKSIGWQPNPRPWRWLSGGNQASDLGWRHCCRVSSHTVTGLSNGTTYHFKLRPRSGALWGDSGSTVSATPSATDEPPGRVTELLASPGNAKVDLAWTAPKGTPAATGYEYCQSTTAAGCTSSGATWTATGTGASALTTTKEVSSLTNGTRYWFRVRAVNGSDSGAPSIQAAAVPVMANERRPATLSAPTTRAGDGLVTFSWSKPTTGPAPTGYSFCINLSGNYCDLWKNQAGDWRPTNSGDNTGHGTTTWVNYPASGASMKAIANNTAYHVAVRGDNGTAGKGRTSPSASVTPRARPGAPTAVTATAGDAQVTLSWSAPAGVASSGYQYRVGDSYSGSVSDWTDVSSGTSQMVGSLTNGIRHTFEVRAYSGGGNWNDTVYGPVSATVAAVPNVKPTGLAVTAGSSSGSATLSWTAPASGTQVLTGYEYCHGTTAGHCAGSNAEWKPTNSTAATQSLTNLVSSAIIHVRVRAVYGSIAGLPADEASGAARS